MRLLIGEDDRALALFLSRGLEADGIASAWPTMAEQLWRRFARIARSDHSRPEHAGKGRGAGAGGGAGYRRRSAGAGAHRAAGVDTRVRCLDLGADDLMIKAFSCTSCARAAGRC